MRNDTKNLSQNNNKPVSLKKKRIFNYCIIGISIIILSQTIISAFSIHKYSSIDETRHADVAIVLGAGVTDEEPSPVFRERINHAIWLYNEGYVDAIIFTGGYSENNSVSDAKVAANYALSKGIPTKNIIIEKKSVITQENLYYAKRIMEEKRYEKALIISDPLHMKRAMLMARDSDIKAYTSPTRTSMYKSWKTTSNFLAREVFFYIGYNIYRVFNN